jgi:hypothetical protein
MARPTQEEIKQEIKALTELKPRIRPTSMFGDDHHAAMDAQVDVLEHLLREAAIYRAYDPGDDEDQGRNVLDAALDARRWLDGESLDGAPTLSASWKELEIT